MLSQLLLRKYTNEYRQSRKTALFLTSSRIFIRLEKIVMRVHLKFFMMPIINLFSFTYENGKFHKWTSGFMFFGKPHNFLCFLVYQKTFIYGLSQATYVKMNKKQRKLSIQYILSGKTLYIQGVYFISS